MSTRAETPRTPRGPQRVPLQLREGQRCTKTPDLTWVPRGPVPALGESSAGARVGPHRQGRVLSVAAAGRAGRNPRVGCTGSLRRACGGPRLVSHSPARPARRAGGGMGGGPSSPRGRTSLSQAQQAGQGCARPSNPSAAWEDQEVARVGKGGGG